MTAIDPKDFVDKSTIQLHYVDYEKKVWTVPVRFTKKRLDELYSDLSIAKIRVKPDDEEIIYDLDMV